MCSCLVSGKPSKDDCRLDFSAEEVVKAVKDAGAKLAWLGYGPRMANKKNITGAHLFGLNRQSVVAISNIVRDEGFGGKKSYYGIDTWLRLLLQNGQAEQSREPMARQSSHSLEKRR